MQEPMNIFMVTNFDMVGYTAVTITSVLKNTKADVNLYILNCGLSDNEINFFKTYLYSFKNLKNFKYYNVDLTQFNGMASWYHSSLDAWAALIFPNIFTDVKKVLHIESDTIAVNDLYDLYSTDLDGYGIGACADIAFGSSYKGYMEHVLKIDWTKHVYFNLGMMLVDCEYWRLHNVTEKCIELGLKYKEKFHCLHQDALNVFFTNNYKRLDNKFNLGDRKCYSKECFDFLDETYFNEQWSDPYLIHFSPSKPWRSDYSFEFERVTKFYNEWWYYCSLTPYYFGLINSFISSRIRDEIKGLKTGVENYGTTNLDTLTANHDWKNITGKVTNHATQICHDNNNLKIKVLKFLGLPIYSKKIANNAKKIKLFGFIPILKIRTNKFGDRVYKLFFLLDVMKKIERKGEK